MACDDDEVIGLIGVTRDPGISPDECYLEYLWVHPGVRQWGIGTSLVREAIAEIRESGYTKASLWVLEGNDTAHRLYRRLGFKETGTINELHPENRHKIQENQMEMILTSSPESS